MKYTFEEYKLFPYIAWILIIGFIIFVYFLTIHLIKTTNALNTQTQITVTALENTD